MPDRSNTSTEETPPAPSPASIAVNAAFTYLKQVSPNSSKFTNFRVEEIKKDGDHGYTLTLSYEVVGEFAFDREKEYKEFKVNSDGVVESMQIRKV